MNNISVRIKKINEKAHIPFYGTEHAAGFDLRAFLKEPIIIKPNEVIKIPTGIALEIPTGLVGLVYARSGLSTKNKISPINKVGVVDSDYRGEIFVFLYNEGSENFTVNDGDRIAQMVISPYFKADFLVVDELNDTTRGENGFGSTGIN